MRKTTLLVAVLGAFTLAGCLDTDLERGLAGAAAGAVAADAMGTDPTATALAGASAGLLCDDAGICRQTR